MDHSIQVPGCTAFTAVAQHSTSLTQVGHADQAHQVVHVTLNGAGHPRILHAAQGQEQRVVLGERTHASSSRGVLPRGTDTNTPGQPH